VTTTVGEDEDIAPSMVCEDEESEDTVEKKLIFFESLFFVADESMRGYLNLDEANTIFSFLDLDRNAQERADVLSSLDTAGTGKIVRLAFVELCVELLWNQPLDEIEKAMENYKEAQSMFSRRNCAKWKQIGRNVDIGARFLIPSCFFSILIWLSNIELEDGYEHGAIEPYVGIYDTSISAAGQAASLVLPILMGLFVLYYGTLWGPHLWEFSVQQLRNHAADIARSRHPEWLANIVRATGTPPPVHKFVSSSDMLRPVIEVCDARVSERDTHS